MPDVRSFLALEDDVPTVVLLGADATWRVTAREVKRPPPIRDENGFTRFSSAVGEVHRTVSVHHRGVVATIDPPLGPRPAWLWTEGDDLLWGGGGAELVRIAPSGARSDRAPALASYAYGRDRRAGYVPHSHTYGVYDVRRNEPLVTVAEPAKVAWVGDELWYYDADKRCVIAGGGSIPWPLRVDPATFAGGREDLVFRTAARLPQFEDGIFAMARDGMTRRLATVPHSLGGSGEVWVCDEDAVWVEHDDGEMRRAPGARHGVAVPAASRLCAAPLRGGPRRVLLERGSGTALVPRDVHGDRALLDVVQLQADFSRTFAPEIVKLRGSI